jgi:hypothetical protein
MKDLLRLLALAALGLLLAPSADAQSYSRGQNVAPAYEGWELDPDGKRTFVFGYLNRNWVEELDVTVGPDNSIAPGSLDQGQPTHFLPRRNRFVFRVPVPEGFDEDDELIWTLTTQGKTERAYATLRPDYFIDNLIKASEQGALEAGRSDPVTRANQAPTLRIDGERTRSVRVGQPLELVAIASDDGVPPARNQRPVSEQAFLIVRGDAEPPKDFDLRWLPPLQVTVGSATGLRLSWYVYRGSGHVTFDPLQTKVWEDTRPGANSPWAPLWAVPSVPSDSRWVTRVTFREPGNYVLRCLASDGALNTDGDVTVTVTP